jgi:hypothetical protein
LTTAIAPPLEYRPPTGSAATVMLAADLDVADASNELVEEPMDYTPISGSRLAAPDLADEAWTDDDTGPMGF